MTVAPDLVAELTRDATNVLPEGELQRKLALGRPLRVKLGIDPTAPDIHLGFAVVLRKLRAFQDAGHVAVLIVGDYTARIGDPSGRRRNAWSLPDEVLDQNARIFAEQAYRILDRDRTEIRFNGEWLGKLDFADVVRLTRTGRSPGCSSATTSRSGSRRTLRSRSPSSSTPSRRPTTRSPSQADVEIGGSDQLYNLLMGRDVMEAYGLEPQASLTYALLVGTDGVEKMASRWATTSASTSRRRISSAR